MKNFGQLGENWLQFIEMKDLRYKFYFDYPKTHIYVIFIKEE